MKIFLITAGVFGVAIVAMAVGALLARKPLKGSCGGLGALSEKKFDGKPVCEVCGGDPARQPSDCSDRLERAEEAEEEELAASTPRRPHPFEG